MSRKRIIYFIILYAALRVFSYFFTPSTPLLTQNIVNTLASAIILFLCGYWLLKKDIRGWYLVAGEIILGGGGGYLAIEGISLRTCLLIVSLGIFFIQTIKDKRYGIFKENKIISYLLSLVLLWAGVAALHGIYSGHDTHLVIADLIPYLFFLYYFPLRELWGKENFKAIIFEMLAAAIIGNLILIILTFIGFGSGFLSLQDSYYHWFRDIAGGKITDLGFNFYRLILNEQLLLVPLLLYFVGRNIKERRNSYLLIFVSLLIILSVNFTRIYFVALLIGLFSLFTRLDWKKWLLYSAGTLIILFGSFTVLHLLSSRGQSLGWELWGLRIQSVVAPETEDSSLSRMLLLPKILEKIETQPFWGSGLGDTVTVYSPILKQTITTPQFDWGYLEIIAEMGLVGLVVWLSLIIYLLSFIFKNRANKYFLASLVALLFINLTSPALFHVFGVIWLTVILGSGRLATANLSIS